MEEKLSVDIEDNANGPRAVAVQACGVVDTAWFTQLLKYIASSPAWLVVGRLFTGFKQ